MTMPPPLPDCPNCDSANTLQKIRADAGGLIWAFCSSCAKTVLLAADGRVLHTEAAGGS